MERYRNLGGDSGILSYGICDDSIDVQFHDGMIYSWNSSKAGDANIQRMKQLATAGTGLHSFINKVVKMLYSSKRQG